MFRHEVLLGIARPVPDVFAYLADVSRTPEWLGRCTNLARTKTGPLSVGEPLTYTYREGSRTGTMQGAVVAFEPEKKLEFHYTDKIMHVTVGFDFTGDAGRTSVHHYIEIAPQTLVFKLLQPLIKSATIKQTAKDTATLKRLLEAN